MCHPLFFNCNNCNNCNARAHLLPPLPCHLIILSRQATMACAAISALPSAALKPGVVRLGAKKFPVREIIFPNWKK